MLSGKMVNRLWASERSMRRGVLANMVESKCSIELKLRSNDLKEAETSVKAELGMATNSLKLRFTVSTRVAWKTSRGSERSLKMSFVVKKNANFWNLKTLVEVVKNHLF